MSNMENPNEFIERVIETNKDMGKALALFNESQRNQADINRLIAKNARETDDRLNRMRGLITANTFFGIIEALAIVWLVITR